MHFAPMRFAISHFSFSRSVALTGALLAFAVGTAEARYSIEPVALREAGMLTCRLDSHGGVDAKSSRSVACVFERAGRAEMEYYSGRMDHVGTDGLMNGRNQDSGNSAADMRSWIVSTPGGQFRSGLLNGTFVGGPAEHGTNAGPDAKMLLNDRGESLLLDPYGWTSQADNDGAAGAVSMELHSAKFGELR